VKPSVWSEPPTNRWPRSVEIWASTTRRSGTGSARTSRFGFVSEFAPDYGVKRLCWVLCHPMRHCVRRERCRATNSQWQ
jgi:hypothetical protein